MEREEILKELERRIDTADGRLQTTVKALAQELGEKPERLYYVMRSLASQGKLQTESHGPKGLELRRGTGEPAKPAERRGHGAGVASGKRGTGPRYCPWCGEAVEQAWKFCPACGDKLPAR